MEILFVSRRQRLGYGNIGRMGVATRMSERVAPFTPPPIKTSDRRLKQKFFTDIFAPFTSDIFFLHVSSKVF